MRAFPDIVSVMGPLVVSTLLLPTVLGGQEVSTGEQVSLRFVWPVGMTSRVEGAHARIRIQNGRADSVGISFSYNLEVRENERGLLIGSRDFQLAGLTPGDEMKAVASILGALAPDYVVSRRGELIAVPDIKEIVSELRALMYDSARIEESSQFRGFMDQFVSEDVLMTYLATEWNALVGSWADAELELGAAYHYETEEPIPILGGGRVLFRYELGMAGRVPCTQDAAETRCVELVLRSSPDPEAMGALLQDFTRRMIDAAGAGVCPPST